MAGFVVDFRSKEDGPMRESVLCFIVDLDDWIETLPPGVRSSSEAVALRERAADLVAEIGAAQLEDAFKLPST